MQSLNAWKRGMESELKSFELFWLSHHGEEAYPDHLESLGEWDEQFYQWQRRNEP